MERHVKVLNPFTKEIDIVGINEEVYNKAEVVAERYNTTVSALLSLFEERMVEKLQLKSNEELLAFRHSDSYTVH